MKKEFKTLKGTWVSANRFIDTEDVVHSVYPYSNLLEKVRGQFPFKCYVFLYGLALKDVVLSD